MPGGVVWSRVDVVVDPSTGFGFVMVVTVVEACSGSSLAAAHPSGTSMKR